VRFATLSTIIGAVFAATVIGCVGSDAVTRPDPATAGRNAVPSAGPMSLHAPVPGALSTSSPPWTPVASSAMMPGGIVRSEASAGDAQMPTTRLLWQNTAGERSIWRLNGTGYSPVLLSKVATVWRIVGSGDFDGDNNADIVWENTSNGDHSIWLMNGNAYSSAVLLPNVPTEWSIATVADMNADGRPDLVWQNLHDGDRSIWIMDGTSYSSATMLPNVSTEWSIVGAGDFFDSGWNDLVWYRASTGQTSIWYMSADTWSGRFDLPPAAPLPWRLVGVGDFNNDFWPDLVWQNVITGERSIWLMEGPSYSSAVILPTVPVEWSIAGVMAPLKANAGSNQDTNKSSPTTLNGSPSSAPAGAY
jgi:AMMECR1 domain-containing protein